MTCYMRFFLDDHFSTFNSNDYDLSRLKLTNNSNLWQPAIESFNVVCASPPRKWPAAIPFQSSSIKTFQLLRSSKLCAAHLIVFFSSPLYICNKAKLDRTRSIVSNLDDSAGIRRDGSDESLDANLLFPI